MLFACGRRPSEDEEGKAARWSNCKRFVTKKDVSPDLIKQVVENVVVHPQRDIAAGDTKHTGKRVPTDPIRRSKIGGQLRKRLK